MHFCIDVDVKLLVSQVAKKLEKKKGMESPTGIGGRWLSKKHKRPHNNQRAGFLPKCESSSSSQPTSVPVLDVQADHVNEGIDAVEDQIHDNIEPEEVYLNTASRDDINQNKVIK